MGVQAPEVWAAAHTMPVLYQGHAATCLLLLRAEAELELLLDDVLPVLSMLSGAGVSVRAVLRLVRLCVQPMVYLQPAGTLQPAAGIL